MRRLRLAAWLVAGACAYAPAHADEIAPEKQKELMRLIYETHELDTLKTHLQALFANLRKNRPDIPESDWEMLEREFSVDDFFAWECDQLDALSLEDLRTINAVFSDEERKAIYDSIVRIHQTTPRANFKEAVNELRDTHAPEEVDAVIDLLRNPAFGRYEGVDRQMIAHQRDEVVKLTTEAAARIKARRH